MFYAAKLINDYQTAKNFYVKFISVCINKLNKLPSPREGPGVGFRGGPQGVGQITTAVPLVATISMELPCPMVS